MARVHLAIVDFVIDDLCSLASNLCTHACSNLSRCSSRHMESGGDGSWMCGLVGVLEG